MYKFIIMFLLNKIKKYHNFLAKSFFFIKQIIVVMTLSLKRCPAYSEPYLVLYKSSCIRIFYSFFICIFWLTPLTSNFQCQDSRGTKYKVLPTRELWKWMHVTNMYKFFTCRNLGVDTGLLHIITYCPNWKVELAIAQ